MSEPNLIKASIAATCPCSCTGRQLVGISSHSKLWIWCRGRTENSSGRYLSSCHMQRCSFQIVISSLICPELNKSCDGVHMAFASGIVKRCTFPHILIQTRMVMFLSPCHRMWKVYPTRPLVWSIFIQEKTTRRQVY
jgi:hypothetical protein